jgi:anti-sigma regulatory factor (Ser/Thr protein kinase)
MIHLKKLSGTPEAKMPRLCLPASMESFESFRSFVLQELERGNGLEELLPQVDLVMEEVLVNVINYAYPKGEGKIEVACLAEGPGRFRVTVRDWGVPFNPLDQATPDLSADISSRQVGGLGIYLVKQMARRLTYEYRDGGNVLTVWFEKNG